MAKEKSAGAVIFSRQDSLKFLLLHYSAGHWGFPKGHVEGNETEHETMAREIMEETGIECVELIPGFRKQTSYFFRRGKETIFKEVIFFLAESKIVEVKLSNEHQGFEWLSFEKALQRLSFKNTKQVLEEANAFLSAKKAD